MAQDTEPLIRLEPGGRAPILSYDLPEPAVYFGRNFIELDYDDVAVFGGTVDVVLESAGDRLIDVIKAVRQVAGLGLKEAKDLVEAAPRTVLRDVGGQDAERARAALEAAGATVRVGSGGVAEMEEELEDSFSEEELATVVEEGMRAGFADGRLFPQVRLSAGSLRLTPKPDGGLDVVSTVPVSPQLAMLDVEEIASRKASGQELSIYTSMFGTLRHRYVPRHRTTRPRIMLVETYRLATYLGAYGAGPVIQTFSLLPGERTTIGIQTFRKTEEERSEASSILDSFTESSASDFEETVASEQANRSTYEESFAYHAEAEAKASWGWGRARVSGGVKGSSNAAREEAAKNTTNATNKHAQKASAKRQIEVDTSFERRETEEEERTTEREIENINVSRTLNFVFRQMNQEYITVLSLVDVRVAYFDGRAASRDEVTLPELDGLLERHVAESERARVRSDVRETLENVLDFRGERHADLVEEREVDADTRYLRVRTEKTSMYRDPVSDTTIEVPGVILSVTKNVMRTDGVIVEALLGVGEALDDYSARLQELEVERRRAEAAKEQALAEQAVLANDVIRENDEDRAELLERLMGGVPLDAPLEIAIRPRGSSDDGSSGGRD